MTERGGQSSKLEFACLLWRVQSAESDGAWPRKLTATIVCCLPTFAASLCDGRCNRSAPSLCSTMP